LEARLAASLGGEPPSPGEASGSAKLADSEIPDDAAVEAGAETSANNWPDESAESAFRAEARERGEGVLPVLPTTEAAEETDTKGLPALDELVKRIPAETRELMDELFRAKFTTVKRVPAKALKS